jgi:hypothetical protein
LWARENSQSTKVEYSTQNVVCIKRDLEPEATSRVAVHAALSARALERLTIE